MVEVVFEVVLDVLGEVLVVLGEVLEVLEVLRGLVIRGLFLSRMEEIKYDTDFVSGETILLTTEGCNDSSVFSSICLEF